MKEALCIAVGGILGALISATINAFANYKIKRIEQRMTQYKLAIEAGIKEYEYMSEIAKAHTSSVATPRYWIYHMIISLNRLLSINTAKTKEIEAALRKDKDTTKLLAKYLTNKITEVPNTNQESVK